MNWLVISSDIRNENVKEIENLLFSKNETTPYEIFLDSPLEKDALYDCVLHSVQATHCIILDFEKLKDQPDFIYLYGVLRGNRSQLFIPVKKDGLGRYSNFVSDGRGLLKSFDDFSSLKNYLENNYPLFEKQEYEHNSLIQLFTMGIPFTADSFAHYLEKDLPDVYQLFVHAGINVNAKTSDGVPMLCISARNDHMDQVEWLLSLGADLNAISGDRGYSAVMDAVWRKNFKITEFLISKGADLNIVSTDGQPILVLAVGNGNAKIVKLLLEKGADPDLKDSMGMSARQYASLFKKSELVELMNLFPPRESDIN